MLQKLFKAGDAAALKTRVDGWLNAVTGIGTSRDKRTGMSHQRTGAQSDEIYESLFLEDDRAAAGIVRLPNHALRKGLIVHCEADADADPGQVEAKKKIVQKAMRALKVRESVYEGSVWGRTFGAGIVFLGSRKGHVEEPLPEDADLEFLTVLDKRDLMVSRYYNDPSEPKFGQPELYAFMPRSSGVSMGEEATASMAKIHESRLVIFEGDMVTSRERERNKGFAHSILYRAWPALQAYNGLWGSVEHLMQDLSQAVLRMKGLVEMLDEQDNATVETRIALMDLARSSARILLIDEDESFERKTTPITGVNEIVQHMNIRLASAFNTPLTVFFGTSAQGLNATGEGDQTAWYDEVEAYQTNELKEPIEAILHMVVRTQLPGEDVDKWSIKFPSLWSQSPTEQATTRKTVAETDVAYIREGVLIAEEVGLSRFGGDEYSVETSMDIDLRRKLLVRESADLLEGDPEPEPSLIDQQVGKRGERETQE